jgi:uncharacterized membrane protein YsdA (DUF1294 family)/cold shock CspA family protein
MPFDGRIKSWDDSRAFGFIEPDQGGQDIFCHITALPARAGRPAVGLRVSFEIELNPAGKKRATRVRVARAASARRAPRARRALQPTAWGGATIFVVPGFALLYLALAALWRIPNWVGLIYVGLSVASFSAYAADKSAARSGSWRTAESSLLLLGAAGGWPGALLAQQWLRHKSVKAAFRQAFWATVWLNVCAFVALSSPWLGAWHSLPWRL